VEQNKVDFAESKADRKKMLEEMPPIKTSLSNHLKHHDTLEKCFMWPVVVTLVGFISILLLRLAFGIKVF
jgi:hypothetical protein